MRAIFRLCFLVIAILVAASPATARDPVIVNVDETFAPLSNQMMSDPVYLYAEDFRAGTAGWVPKTLNIQTETYWQQTTYDALDGMGMRGVMWCGRNYVFSPPASSAGYGNSWRQYLDKSFHLPADMVTMTYALQYDAESGYDFVTLQVSNDGGTSFIDLESWTGNSGGFANYATDLTAYAGQDVIVRFRFKSDSSWSDEDGLYESDGACRLDWVQITGFPVDDFGSGTNGWTPRIPEVLPMAYRLEASPACAAPFLPCAMFCNSWVAYDPVTGVFPWAEGEAFERSMWLVIESPTLPLPGDATTYYLDFDVYADLPLDNLVFYAWKVAAPAPENGGAFRSNNTVYYSPGPSGLRHMHIDITRYMTAGASSIRIQLAGVDQRPTWGGVYGSGDAHTPAPFFDNVSITAVGTASAGIDISGFPEACDPGYTAPGTDVVVNPIDPLTGTQPVTLTFDAVSGAGTTSVETSEAGTPPPAGFRLGTPPVYYEIQSTAVFSGAVEVCIFYSALSYANESNLRIFHLEDGAWVDRTVSLDTGSDVICAQVTSFSPFIVCEPEPKGDIAGMVTASCPEEGTPLYGVTVDAFEMGTGVLVGAAVTDALGNYLIEDIPAGDYTVTIVTPLGYSVAAEEIIASVPPGGVVDADFGLSCLTITANPRSMGYWKHQVAVATGGKGSADVSAATLCQYFDTIALHFNSNRIHPILVYQPPASGECTDILVVAKQILNLTGSAAMIDRARQHFTALLLNVSSGKISLREAISQDGATVSQAITYCDDLVTDAVTANDEAAKDIADMINNGVMVPVQVIPLSTPDIEYVPGKGDVALPTDLVLKPNYPNPFNPTTTIQYELPGESDVRLDVFDVGGRMVRTIESGHRSAGRYEVRWNATTDSGAPVATGVYWLRLRAGGQVRTVRMVLLK